MTARTQNVEPVEITASNVSGATGAAVPSQAQLVGGTDGTNLRALYMRTSLAGSLNPQAAAEVTAYLMAQNADGTLSRVPFAYGDAFTGGVLAAQGMGWDGTNNVRQRVANTFKYSGTLAIAAGATGTAWTPAAGKKFRLMGFAISCDVAGLVLLRDGAGGTSLAQGRFSAAGTTTRDWGNGKLSAAANNILEIYNAGAGEVNVAVEAWGTEE